MILRTNSTLYAVLFTLIATVIWGQGLFTIVIDLVSPGISSKIFQSDFANYWLAGLFVVESSTELLYVHEQYFQAMQEFFGEDIEVRNWSYPPHALLFLWPLGLLPYKFAVAAFLISGLFFFSVAGMATFRAYGRLACLPTFIISQLPVVIMMLACMQNGLHLGALALAGFLFIKKNPVLSGLCFAILTIKPQLGILIPFLLVFVGAWRAVLWAGVFTIALICLSAIIFGLQDWLDYIQHTIPYQTGVMHHWNGIFLKMMPGLFASLRVWGFDSQVAQAAHFVFALFLLPVVLWRLYLETDWMRRLFILFVGTFLITPYSFIYDMGAFSVVAGVLLSKVTLDEPASAQILWPFAAALPALVLLLGEFNMPITPIFLLSLFICVGFGAKRQQSQ